MSEFIDNKDSSKSLHKIAISPETSKSHTWLLSRLWRKPEVSLHQLSLKAYSIKPEAEKFHKELMRVLDNFSSNDILYPYVREVIDPLLREIDQILNKLQNNLTHDALDKYSQWTEKARRWVHLCNKVDDENLMIAIHEHIVLRSFELIDRDMQLIVEYRSNQNPAADITIFISALETMKSKPDLPLEQIATWKKDLDLKRAAVVNTALHTIDSKDENTQGRKDVKDQKDVKNPR